MAWGAGQADDPRSVIVSSGEVLAQTQPFSDRQLGVDFADQVVIPTYEQLANQANALSQAIAMPWFDFYNHC